MRPGLGVEPNSRGLQPRTYPVSHPGTSISLLLHKLHKYLRIAAMIIVEMIIGIIAVDFYLQMAINEQILIRILCIGATPSDQGHLES